MFKRVRVCTPMYPLANQRCTLGAPLYHCLAILLQRGLFLNLGALLTTNMPQGSSGLC